MIDTVTAADFETRLGRSGTLGSAAAVDLEVTLADVQTLGAPAAPGQRAPFSVLLQGPARPILEQGIQRLSLAGWEPLELFVVPVGPGPDGGIRYEAIFS